MRGALPEKSRGPQQRNGKRSARADSRHPCGGAAGLRGRIAAGGFACGFEQSPNASMAGHAATTSFAGPLDIPNRAGGIADDGFDDARFGDLQAAAEDVLFRFRGGSNHRVGFPWFGGPQCSQRFRPAGEPETQSQHRHSSPPGIDGSIVFSHTFPQRTRKRILQRPPHSPEFPCTRAVHETPSDDLRNLRRSCGLRPG